MDLINPLDLLVSYVPVTFFPPLVLMLQQVQQH